MAPSSAQQMGTQVWRIGNAGEAKRAGNPPSLFRTENARMSNKSGVGHQHKMNLRSLNGCLFPAWWKVLTIDRCTTCWSTT